MTTAEEQALLGAAALRTPIIDIEVYYLYRLSDNSAGGSLVTNSLKPGDLGFANSVEIAAAWDFEPASMELSTPYLVLAHEVGHILENRPNATREKSIDLGHYPFTGTDPTNKERVNLMVSARPSIVNGRGYALNDDGTHKKIPGTSRPPYGDFTPWMAVLDSRRLTAEQETKMTTGHGATLLTPPEG